MTIGSSVLDKAIRRYLKLAGAVVFRENLLSISQSYRSPLRRSVSFHVTLFPHPQQANMLITYMLNYK
jgi:hypothetical protein